MNEAWFGLIGAAIGGITASLSPLAQLWVDRRRERVEEVEELIYKARECVSKAETVIRFIHMVDYEPYDDESDMRQGELSKVMHENFQLFKKHVESLRAIASKHAITLPGDDVALLDLHASLLLTWMLAAWDAAANDYGDEQRKHESLAIKEAATVSYIAREMSKDWRSIVPWRKWRMARRVQRGVAKEIANFERRTTIAGAE